MNALFILVIQLLAGLTPQASTCTSVRTGTFAINSEGAGTTLIRRTESQQIETNVALDMEVVFDVSWVDSCTYLLHSAEVIRGGEYMHGNPTDTIIVEILEVDASSYKVLTSSNFAKMSIEAEISIVDSATADK